MNVPECCKTLPTICHLWQTMPMSPWTGENQKHHTLIDSFKVLLQGTLKAFDLQPFFHFSSSLHWKSWQCGSICANDSQLDLFFESSHSHSSLYALERKQPNLSVNWTLFPLDYSSNQPIHFLLHTQSFFSSTNRMNSCSHINLYALTKVSNCGIYSWWWWIIQQKSWLLKYILLRQTV